MLRIQEKILLHQVRQGNRLAFNRLYQEYIDKIRRFVLFKISQKEKAEELTNTIFIKTFNYLLTGQKIKNFRAFLYQTARHLIIDFYRTRTYEISLEEAPEISSGKDINAYIDQKIKMENIKKYLSILKPEHQEMVVLRFFDELSFKEIAAIVGETEENVRTIVHRQVKKLREHLRKFSSF